MATDIRVPTLGESVSEATIGKWFKKPGDAVTADEPLVELETDKVTLEVNAPASGILSEISAKDGETVGVGALLGAITEGAPGVAAAPKAAEVPKAAATPRKGAPLRSGLRKRGGGVVGRARVRSSARRAAGRGRATN